MIRRLQPNVEGLSQVLAKFDLEPTDGPGRPFLAGEQGQAIVLVPAARRSRVTARTAFGLSRGPLHPLKRGIVLASEPLAAVEEAASQKIGARVSAAGFRVGAGGLSKLTVCFVDKYGPSAFAKFPLTARAGASLAHEEGTVRFLGRFDRLSPHLPDVISGLDMGGNRGVLFTAGPSRRVQWPGGEVSSFLATLHEVTARVTSIQASGLVEAWHQRLEARRPLLGARKSSLVDGAIQLVRNALGHKPVDHTTAHGDFTRWNLRQGSDGLFVFDWEASVGSALPYHDLFHYFAAESALLRRPSPTSRFQWRRLRLISERISPEWVSQQYPLYLGYLVETTLWYSSSREWHRHEQPGPFWRFLWDELAKANQNTRFKG